MAKPDPEKFEHLRAFPRPNDSKEVQSLIGIIKTFERWNLSLSAKCEKIRELGKKKNKFLWTPDHDVEFTALKKEIIGNRNVISFDLGKRIEIYTDEQSAKEEHYNVSNSLEVYNLPRVWSAFT